MNNLEEKLKNIKARKLGMDEKELLWQNIVVAKARQAEQKTLSINIFNNMKKYIAIAIIVLVILGGGTMASANNAGPGDFLFGLDKALERLELRFASEDKEAEIKIKIAEERIAEIKQVSEEKGTRAPLVADLSTATALEIEADVFTNETVVKIEADNKNYGYVSILKTKDELVAEIAEKYSLDESKVAEIIDFEIEDRDSRAEDKGFLNKLHSVRFSENESEDVGESLSDVEEILNNGLSEADKEKLENALNDILILLGDDAELEIERKGNKIEIESESDDIKIKIKVENENKSGNGNNDDSDDDDDNDDEDEDEDDDNSGSGNDDDDEDDDD